MFNVKRVTSKNCTLLLKAMGYQKFMKNLDKNGQIWPNKVMGSKVIVRQMEAYK